jgi:putative chitinase
MGLFDWFRRKPDHSVDANKMIQPATGKQSLQVQPPLFEEPAAPVAPVAKVPNPISPKAPTLITLDQLRRGMGITRERADYWDDFLNEAMSLYQINTPKRIAAFLAQVGHESGRLRYVQEIYGPTPAQRRYEGRKDLGNIYPGDGKRFIGHGLIQTTGRFNHRRVTQRLRARFPNLGVPDFEAEPKLLTLPRWAALSAADYWDMINGNRMADAGQFKLLTRRINGGYNGLADRLKLWESFKKAL